MRSARIWLVLALVVTGLSAPAFGRCATSLLMEQGQTGGNFWTDPGRQYGGWYWIAGHGNNLLNAGGLEAELGIDSGLQGGVPLEPTSRGSWLNHSGADPSVRMVMADWYSGGSDGCGDLNNNRIADPNEVLAVLVVDDQGQQFALASVGGNWKFGWDLSQISNGVPSIFGKPTAGIPMQPVPRPTLSAPREAAGGRVSLQVTPPPRQQIKTFDDVGGSRNMIQGFHILQDDILLAEIGGTGGSANVKATPGRPMILRTIFGYPGDAGFYVDASVMVPNVGEVPEDPGSSDDAGPPDDAGQPDDRGRPDDLSGDPGADDAADDPGAAGDDPSGAGALAAGAADAAGRSGEGGEDDEPVDSDEDELFDDEDNCPDVANPDQEDMDEDGVGDFCDSCPFDANPDQDDGDDDGLGDDCDPCPEDPENLDGDGDGLCDIDDNCPAVANVGQEDADGDGAGDECDDTFDPWVAEVGMETTSAMGGGKVEMNLSLTNRSEGARRASVRLMWRDARKSETEVAAAETCLPKVPWEVEVKAGDTKDRKCAWSIPAGAAKGKGAFVLKLVDASDEKITLESETSVTVK